jgi:hypothetical protein
MTIGEASDQASVCEEEIKWGPSKILQDEDVHKSSHKF